MSKLIKKRCIRCGTVFNPHGGQLYCKKRCRDLDYKETREATQKIYKVSRGHYVYTDPWIKIVRLGYHHPDKNVIWEATDAHGVCVAHGFTKKEIIMRIDKLKEEDKLYS